MKSRSNHKKKIHIITGYSGSGKTTALRYFEELGFYCVDNLPPELLPEFASVIKSKSHIKKMAVVIDARGQAFMKNLEPALNLLKRKLDLSILFFESSLPIVVRRYKESRLKHPLSLEGSITQGYNREKLLLRDLRQHAHLVIDSSSMNIHQLRKHIHHLVNLNEKDLFEIRLLSFGFKHGLPPEADVVIDVRFFKNPYFEEKLKHKNGLNRAVQKFIFSDLQIPVFIKKIKPLITYLATRYRKEGKHSTTIAFGCTGGQHRSVAIVQTLSSQLKNQKNIVIQKEHRDINR